MSGRCDMAVIGGGLIGLAAAHAGARAGMRVVVLEAERVGRHASSASAGGVRSLNRDPAEVPLARAALPLWRTLARDLGHATGFAASGQIRVAEDDAAMAALEARAAQMRGLGYTHEEIIGGNALALREPEIARHCLGALIVRDDGFADPLRTLAAYRAACRALGVEVREGTAVAGVAASGGGVAVDAAQGEVTAPVVVNAAGAWGAEIAASAGEPVPLVPQALQMSVTAPVRRLVAAVIGSEGRKLSLKQMETGCVVIGGGYRGTIEDGVGRPRHASVAANVASAVRLFPALRQAHLTRSWAGIEGWTRDGLPVLAPSRTVPGLIHAFGFSGHGFALAPLVGQIVRAMATGAPLALPLDAFAVDRFAREVQDA